MKNKNNYNEGDFHFLKQIYNNKQGQLFFSLLFLSFLSVSCSNQNGSSDQAQINMSDLNGLQNNTALGQKVFVEEALINDIKNHVVACPASANTEKQVCIQICHVPPGNPSVAIDKILPLQAIKAHLNHGSEHAEDRDYLGACKSESSIPSDDSDAESSPEPSDTSTDTSSTDTTSDPNATPSDSTQTDTTTSEPGSIDSNTGPITSEPGSTDTTTSSDDPDSADSTVASDTSVVPLWCEEVVSIDSNCDGIDDATGEPIF